MNAWNALKYYTWVNVISNMIAALCDRKSNLSSNRKTADCQQRSDTGLILAPPPWLHSLATSVALLLIRLLEDVQGGLYCPPHLDSCSDKGRNDRWGCHVLQLMALYLTVKFECLLLQAVQGSPVRYHSRYETPSKQKDNCIDHR